jgi:hypothetical protein
MAISNERRPIRSEETVKALGNNFRPKKFKNRPATPTAPPVQAPSAEDTQKITDLTAQRSAQRDAAQKAHEEKITLRTGGTPDKGPGSLHNELVTKVPVLSTLGRPTGDRTEKWRTITAPGTGKTLYKSLEEAKAGVTASRAESAATRAETAKAIAEANAPAEPTSRAPKKVVKAKTAKPAYTPKKVR